MVDWQSQPEKARIYLIPLGPFIGRPGGLSIGGGVFCFSSARIVIQDFGKRIVDETVARDALPSIQKQLPESLASQLQAHIDNLE